MAIRALRRQLGLSQAQFAEQVGVTRETISRLENHVYPPSRGVKKRFYQIWEVEQDRLRRARDPVHRAVIARLNV